MSKSEDRRTEIALFRYTLILPLIRGEYPAGGKQALREQMASRHYDIPYSSRSTVSVSTLARWERLYRQDGFEGLKPKPRAISEETLGRRGHPTACRDFSEVPSRKLYRLELFYCDPLAVLEAPSMRNHHCRRALNRVGRCALLRLSTLPTFSGNISL